MKIINYYFSDGGLIRLDLAGNPPIWIKPDHNSGRVVTREKVNSISQVQHTGIWLGTEISTNTPLILHNHYRFGTAHVSSLDSYAYGRTVHWQNQNCVNHPLRVLEIALAHAKAGRTYNAIYYNCQTFTNIACYNKNYSQDVTKWAGRIFGGAAFLLFIKALT